MWNKPTNAIRRPRQRQKQKQKQRHEQRRHNVFLISVIIVIISIVTSKTTSTSTSLLHLHLHLHLIIPGPLSVAAATNTNMNMNINMNINMNMNMALKQRLLTNNWSNRSKSSMRSITRLTTRSTRPTTNNNYYNKRCLSFIPNHNHRSTASTSTSTSTKQHQLKSRFQSYHNTIQNISFPSSSFHHHRYQPQISSFTTLSATSKKSNHIFHHGERVQIEHTNTIDGTATTTATTTTTSNYCEGMISERKGGWYTVQIVKDDGSITQVKRRGGQMKKITTSSLSSSSSSSSSSQSNSMKDQSQSQSQPSHTNINAKSNANTNANANINPNDNMLLTEQIQTVPNLPTIIDLDAAILNQHTNQDRIKNSKDLQYIQQCVEFTKYKKWVVFTDLHCSPSSLHTCINVLHTVHKAAKERGAGVLFLGDFWHHRGSVRVDCLNAVLDALSDWTVPMIMIPGNHDQVTLSGLEHALTPLQNAYRISTTTKSSANDNDDTFSPSSPLLSQRDDLPGILIFSHPTKIHNALFVPHIRDVGSMQSVLQSKIASSSTAVFVHADVTGAYMNDLIVSTHGVEPSYFPSSVPIYSGHFHKPHVVKQQKVQKGANIRYVGSPYETTLAEAGQEKALLVLDSRLYWTCIEEIPLRVGKKHWRIKDVDGLLDLCMMEQESAINDSISGPIQMVMPGDRVVVSVGQEELEKQRQEIDNIIGNSNSKSKSSGMSAFDIKVKALRSMGASVEVRETKPMPNFLMESNVNEKDPDAVNKIDLDWLLVEDMSTQTTWSNFLQNEVQRETITNNTATKVLEAGNKLLDDLDCGSSETKENYDLGIGSKNSAMLLFEEITVQGFGPFKESITYPLKERGLVLVKGTNRDGGSDSNGTGKSSLAMSALWALTGSIDPRPMQDAKVSDIVNDLSKSAKVSIRGTIDNTPFVIARAKTSSKGSLTFILDGEDLTRQSMKETQSMIDEKLGAGSQVLSRTIFHGQHAVNGLLETTDAKLKEELSLIVSLKNWQDAAAQARKRGRALSKKGSELDGMLGIREQDLENFVLKINASEEAVSAKQDEVFLKEEEIRQFTDAKIEDTGNIDLEGTRELLDESEREVKLLEEQLQSISTMFQEETNPLRIKLNGIQSQLKEMKQELFNKQRQIDRNEAALESAEEALDRVKKKWGITDTSNLQTFVPPSICPTCNQSTSNEDSHIHLESELRTTMTSSNEQIEMISNMLLLDNEKITLIQNDIDQLETENNELVHNLEQKEKDWQISFTNSQKDVQLGREKYSKLSSSFASDLKKLEYINNLKHLEANADSDLRLCRNNLEIAKDLRDTTKKELENMMQNVESLKTDREATRRESAIMSTVAENFGGRGIQTYVLQNTILALQLVTQSYLDELSDGNLRLRLELDNGDRISRTTSVLGPDGSWVERPLSSLSGGQWRRCSLSLSLGFSDLVARRGRLCSSLLVLDEPLTHLDSSGRDNVGKLLRKVIQNQASNSNIGVGGLSVSTIIIILQDLVAEELSESFDRIDEVVKSQGHSTVIVDE